MTEENKITELTIRETILVFVALHILESQCGGGDLKYDQIMTAANISNYPIPNEVCSLIEKIDLRKEEI